MSLLWHYTHSATLHEIIKTRTVWATDIRFLNDSQEYQYCLDLVEQEILGINPQYRDIWDSQRAAFAQSDLTKVHARVGVFCLTEVADDLSQWRGYAPNGGVAIGIEPASLDKLYAGRGDEAKPPAAVMGRLEKCLYDRREQISKLAEDMADALERATKGSKPNEVSKYAPIVYERAAKIFFYKLVEYAPTLKHPKFSQEKETRVIVTRSAETVDFRAGAAVLIPYVPLAFDPEFIACIQLGPTAEPELAHSSISLMAKRYGIDPEILPMTIPLRTSRL